MLKKRLCAALCAAALLIPTAVATAAEAPTAVTQSTEVKVQDTVYAYLTDTLKLTPAAAAGIMGNVMIECSFDPTKGATDTNDLYSFGLMMWNGPRYEALKNYCKENSLDHMSAEGQLDYLRWELENTEKAAYSLMLDIPNTAEGAVRAAILWASEFERCTRTSFGLRIYYALNVYWPQYAHGTAGETRGIYGYYYNVPDNVKYGEPLTLYGAVVSFSSHLRSITAGVYTEDGELVTGRTIERDAFVGNIGVIDNYIVMNKLARGSYYYTVTAVNEAGEYIVERHHFTVSDEKTSATLVKEQTGTTACGFGVWCPGFAFSDMPKASDWAHSGIDFVVDAGLFEGKPGGLFAPRENMSRAMFVTVLCRLIDRYGIGGDAERGDEAVTDTDTTDTGAEITVTENGDATVADGTQPDESTTGGVTDDTTGDDNGEPEEDTFDYFFTDVPRGRWYTEAVYRASVFGLVEGKTENTFAPDEELTRAQLAMLMYRFAELCGLDMTSRASLEDFADVSKVPAWARDALEWAIGAGLMTGNNDYGTVKVDAMAFAERRQVAAIVERFVKLVETQSEQPTEN